MMQEKNNMTKKLVFWLEITT